MNLLSIGGSDPSSGAGIQSDLRIFSSNVHWLTVITNSYSTKYFKIWNSRTSIRENFEESITINNF